MQTRRKALAYITRGARLLVFEHEDIPAAGLQVPGGEIEPDETPEAAALREAQEETGLTALSVVRFLGEQTQDMRPWGKQELQQRYFFHLRCNEITPKGWVHGERTPSKGQYQRDEDGFVRRFRFYWAELDAVPALAANQDYFIGALRAGPNLD